MEIATLLGGAISGFVLKYMAQAAKDRQEQFEMFIKTIQASDASADKAMARDSSSAGQWVRRLIVIAILFGVILAPFILAMIGKPVIVEVSLPVKKHLLGMFSTGGKSVFYELNSYLLIPELRQSLMAIIGFYFGAGSAKR